MLVANRFYLLANDSDNDNKLAGADWAQSLKAVGSLTVRDVGSSVAACNAEQRATHAAQLRAEEKRTQLEVSAASDPADGRGPWGRAGSGAPAGLSGLIVGRAWAGRVWRELTRGAGRGCLSPAAQVRRRHQVQQLGRLRPRVLAERT